MKKKLIPILCLLILFCLSACSMDGGENFEYDKDVMIEMTKSIVTQYKDMSGAQADYLLSEGETIEKTAVTGFQQAQTTDHVGSFVGFDTSEDVVTFENGAKGDILCSIIVKFSDRDVRVAVSYSENKLFKARFEEEMKTLEYYASTYGYKDAEDLVQNDETLKQLGYRTDSAEHFITDIIMYSQQSPVYPYTANECEVSAVYDMQELLLNGAKNMGVGMGVVFLVLIFIACIIYLLRFIPKLFGKKEQKPAVAKMPASPKPVAAAPTPTAFNKTEKTPAAVGEEVKDQELIAVITAALHAYLSEGAGNVEASGVVHPPAYTASNDKLVVRSIRKVG